MAPKNLKITIDSIIKQKSKRNINDIVHTFICNSINPSKTEIDMVNLKFIINILYFISTSLNKIDILKLELYDKYKNNSNELDYVIYTDTLISNSITYRLYLRYLSDNTLIYYITTSSSTFNDDIVDDASLRKFSFIFKLSLFLFNKMNIVYDSFETNNTNKIAYTFNNFQYNEMDKLLLDEYIMELLDSLSNIIKLNIKILDKDIITKINSFKFSY